MQVAPAAHRRVLARVEGEIHREQVVLVDDHRHRTPVAVSVGRRPVGGAAVQTAPVLDEVAYAGADPLAACGFLLSVIGFHIAERLSLLRCDVVVVDDGQPLGDVGGEAAQRPDGLLPGGGRRRDDNVADHRVGNHLCGLLDHVVVLLDLRPDRIGEVREAVDPQNLQAVDRLGNLPVAPVDHLVRSRELCLSDGESRIPRQTAMRPRFRPATSEPVVLPTISVCGLRSKSRPRSR